MSEKPAYPPEDPWHHHEREGIPFAGLLLALLYTALVLDFCWLLYALAEGRWVYSASLVLVGAVTFVAAGAVKDRR